ncbi:hypothetical protein MSIMFI_03797 [Mycobacterium simulans]|uniref:DUF3631 domain-containing protein n=1 Tax=Mycobacterium simulans TaxID=627089 RepID=UPI00199D67F3|nr:DUF3631 domain-containing protein [Mycobacterium simulans]SON62272.1 hypothetical protein MSIMFI_03797 [Mycobacterium simulans]
MIPYGTDYPEASWIDRDGQPITVDGAELLDGVHRFAGRFLAFPTPHHLVVVVLWIVHTWAVKAFYVTPRLVLDSPEPGSGKTRVLEILALLCRGARLTLSTTTAALYRRIAAAADQPPTVLQDEADAVFGRTTTPQAEDLRALFNAGYKRGATVDRCEGDAKNMKVRQFPVFAPVALAGLVNGSTEKNMRTVLDRAVILHMRRRAPDEYVDEFRERDAAAEAEPLCQKLEAWATANLDTLAAARPSMPEGVRDRPAEVWEALLAIADAAGTDWPERARAACRHFVLDAEPDALSLGMRLLRDVKTTFADQDRMHSAELVTTLTSDPESEWRDLWGKPLDQNRLAKELKRYGVRSRDVRIGGMKAKGYLVDGDDGLAQAWRRYLPAVPARDKRDTGDIAGQGDSAPRQSRDRRDSAEAPETISELRLFDDVSPVSGVSPEDGTPERNGHCRGQFIPPTGAGRCCECGFHVATQGHRDGCPAKIRAPIGGITPATPGMTDRVVAALAKAVER